MRLELKNPMQPAPRSRTVLLGGFEGCRAAKGVQGFGVFFSALWGAILESILKRESCYFGTMLGSPLFSQTPI